jgi:acetylornithine deacetylase/succinyl-diaminopimelate desuccinylase-like protein
LSEELKKYLKDLVSLQSISAEKDKANESRKTAELIKSRLEGIGVQVEIIENKIEEKNPLIIGKIVHDSTKPNILFYSHYDVQPASKDDGWDTEPFEMVEKDDGYVYGRGTNDDKGPIVATHFAIEELKNELDNLPVNISFLYEGEEESSSGGFEETVTANKDFYGKIDGILILDTSWFNDEQPSMDYGFRGMAYMEIDIKGPKKDQHSGAVGGSLREPMTDLVYLFNTLLDLEGKVLIEGFYDKVKPLTDEEKELYKNIKFDLSEYKTTLGVQNLPINDPNEVLMNLWRNPCLSIHGIQGAFSGPGLKTVIPGNVIGKVSTRLVPDQDPKEIGNLFMKHIEKEFTKLKSPNTLNVKMSGEGDWWYGDLNNYLFKHGFNALKEYWGVEPTLTRSGGSIPIVPFMEKIFKAPAMGFGVGQESDGAHSQNERLRIKNLVGAKEVLKMILLKVGKSA